MALAPGRRRALVIGLFVCLLLLFVALGTLNAFNLKVLNPASPVQTLVFTALSTIAFLLFLGILVLLIRNILKLYADQRSRVLGTRLRTRMLWGAVLVSVVPLVFMSAFSYLLMNRAVDRWFSQPISLIRSDSELMSTGLLQYAQANARAEADSIALDLHARGNSTVQSALRRHVLTLQNGFAVVYRDGEPIASLQLPSAGPSPAPPSIAASADENTREAAAGEAAAAAVPLGGAAASSLLAAAQRNDSSIYAPGGGEYVLAYAPAADNSVVVIGMPLPPGVPAAMLRLRHAEANYWALFRERREIRSLYSLLLAVVTVLALFVCCWLALNLSKQVTRPIESLAGAMEAIAIGSYSHRVQQSSTEELGELADSFNAMATDLENSRSLAERYTVELSAANASLLARRTELETLLETIPNGVATLTPERRIAIANRAFYEMLDPGGRRSFDGVDLHEIIPSELREPLDHLLRRSHRMGSASAETDMPLTGGGHLHLSVTCALLESDSTGSRRHLGYVLVLENLTDLLQAQRQNAWKEVARRVAHEIKNPLTPISLNAEQVHRHILRLQTLLQQHGLESHSVPVIVRGAEVISASVETMRSLVDQFSSLAEFPAPTPRPSSLPAIVDSALALFAGRINDVHVKLNLPSALPLVLADPEALRRALSNLVDNAIEAMNDSLLRELHICARQLPSGLVELTIADTGSGLTAEMRERLFVPYFSTKARGTGLGLAIAAKVLQDQGGSLRAESNVPAGARFIMELRPAASLDSDPALDPVAAARGRAIA